MVENNKVCGILKIVFGAVMIATALIGYIPLGPVYWVEMTMISNLLGGGLLLIDGILNLKDKSIPAFLTLTVCSGLTMVLLFCLITLATPNPFNFGGIFFFLHVINPILMLISYVFLCKDRAERTFPYILTAAIFTALYGVFDFIVGHIRGFFVYGFFMPDDLSLAAAAIVEAVVIIIMTLIGLVLFKLNRKAHKNYQFE